jgi:hypothetical protein
LALALLALAASLVESINSAQHHSSLVVSLMMPALIQMRHVAQFALIFSNGEISERGSGFGLSRSSMVPVS